MASAEQLTYCGTFLDEDGEPRIDEGEPMRFIKIENKDQLTSLMQVSARAIISYNQRVARVLDGALTNFAETMRAPSEKSTRVSAGDVFVRELEAEVRKAIGSKIPSFPGSETLFLFKYQAALDKAMKEARLKATERAVADIVIDLNSSITKLATPPLETTIVDGFRSALRKKAGAIEGDLDDEQVAWGAELCAGLLQLQDLDRARFPDDDVADLMDSTEVGLYEAWIRSRYAAWDADTRGKLQGLVPPSAEVRFKIVEGDQLEQIAGTVNDPVPEVGERIAQRLDHLTTPWALDVPIRACLHEIPDAPGPKCGLFDPEGRLIVQPSVEYALAVQFLSMPYEGGWKEDMNCIDPYRSIGSESCAPDSWSE